MAEENKKPTHEVIVQRIIDDFDALDKLEKKNEISHHNGGILLAFADMAFSARTKGFLEILKNMIIPNKALADFVNTIDITKPGSRATFGLIVQQLKELQPKAPVN